MLLPHGGMTYAPEPYAVHVEAFLAAPLPAAVFHADSTVRAANAGWLTLLGHDEAALRGVSLRSLVSDPTLDLGALLRAASPAAVSFRRADGSAIVLDLVIKPVDPEGQRGWVVYVKPATSPVVPGGEVIPDEAFRHAPVGLGVFDAQFRFKRANDALAAMLDLTPAELVGRAYAAFVHPDDAQPAAHRMRAAREGALSPGQVERRFVSATGRVVWVRAGGVRMVSDGEPSYFGVFLDINERHEAEAERGRLHEQVVHGERLRTLGQIAAGIAHEINNPASIAIGGVDLTRRRLGAALAAAKAGELAVVRRHLESLEASLRYCEDGTLRVAQAARRLGSFSSLRSGRIDRLDPNDAVRRALELVRNELRHRARLVVELGEVPRMVGDAERIIQAVTNLLINAAQAVDGTPDTHAITVSTWSDGTTVYVRVADTGAGMTRDVRDHLFEPFFASRGKDRGAGLGLTVVHDVVSQHRGRIDVNSEPGKGSMFTLAFPLNNGLEDRAVDVTPSAVASRARRVLVVDDEPFLLAVIGEILQGQYEVVTAPGGREALAVLAGDTAFDVVLCDLMMPEIDGVEVHTWLAANAPTLAARTVFCTGGAFTTRAERYLARADIPVLEKPLTAEDVLERLARASARNPA